MKKIRKSYRIADVGFDLCYQSETIGKMCADYECEPLEQPEFIIDLSEDDLLAEKMKSEEEFSDESYESLAIYRKLCKKMLEYQSFLFHCSAVAVDGKAYLFAAPSGTGKSTHTRMWRQYFGDKAVMINDDKPLLQVQEDAVYVCGTPWCGKHRLQTNQKAPIQGICILHRGKENTIRKISPIDAYPDLYRQTYRPNDREKMLKTLALLKKVTESVPMYEMHCNISEEAAQMAWNAMKEQGM